MKIAKPFPSLNLYQQPKKTVLELNKIISLPTLGSGSSFRKLALTRDRLDLSRGLIAYTRREKKNFNGLQDFVTAFQTYDNGLKDIRSQLLALREQAVKASKEGAGLGDGAASGEAERLMSEIDQNAASTWDKTRKVMTEAVSNVLGNPAGTTDQFVIDLGEGENGKLEINGISGLTGGDLRTGRLVVIQTGPNEGQNHSVDMGLSDCGYLGLNRIDLTTQESASRSITIIDKAIDGVSSQRAGIGATINVLGHRINYLNTMAANLTEAESRIRDADMAKEYTDYVTYQLRAQFAMMAASLAQKMPLMILKLLETPPGYPDYSEKKTV
ncbi:MAG: flagellin [Firmicutes bacterium]|nr:flagellin [Bacillota bacterium]